MTLFRRKAALQIGENSYEDFDFDFSIKRTLKKESNTAKITVYNLDEDSRSRIASLEDPFVNLEAGYEGGDLSTIFRGLLRRSSSTHVGTEWRTVIDGNDGKKRLKTSRRYPPKAKVATVIEDLLNAADIEARTVIQSIKSAVFENGSDEFEFGTVVNGVAIDEAEKLCNDCGLELSIQNGAAQVIARNKALAVVAPILSAASGLIDSPSLGSRGVVRARCLIQPLIAPGFPIQFDSEGFEDVFRIVNATYTGSTMGNPWYINIECRKIA